MNTSLIGAVCAAALLSLSSAQAAEPVTTESVQVPGGRAAYTLAPQEFSNYGNAYLLDTGHTLKLRQKLNRYFIQLKGEPEVEIFGLAPTKFTSRAGTQFAFRDDGNMVIVSGFERLPGAPAALAGEIGKEHYAYR